MQLLQWDERFQTGIRAIDADHKMLFDIINALHEGAATGAPQPAVAKNLDALVRYVEEHFAREEKFMEGCRYPDLAAHTREHHGMAENVYRLQRLYRSQPDALNQTNVWNFLSRWLSHHILQSDREYIPYVQGQKQGALEDGMLLRKVTLRVPAGQVDALFRCSSILAAGGASAEALMRTIGDLGTEAATASPSPI